MVCLERTQRERADGNYSVYLFCQFSVDWLQFLTVWTGRGVELDQNVFIGIVDDGIKGLCNNHLQHHGQREL